MSVALPVVEVGLEARARRVLPALDTVVEAAALPAHIAVTEADIRAAVGALHPLAQVLGGVAHRRAVHVVAPVLVEREPDVSRGQARRVAGAALPAMRVSRCRG